MSENNATVVEAPAIDLPPLVIPPPVVPIPTPAPPATPQFNAIAKKFMQGGSPVTQETTTRQTVYAGLPQDSLSMPGAPKKAQPCIAYMAQISQDANCSGYQIEVSRTLPAV